MWSEYDLGLGYEFVECPTEESVSHGSLFHLFLEWFQEDLDMPFLRFMLVSMDQTPDPLLVRDGGEMRLVRSSNLGGYALLIGSRTENLLPCAGPGCKDLPPPFLLPI